MTSYTKKLYEIAPSAARQIRRRELHDYRWGGSARNVTLASFGVEVAKAAAPMGAAAFGQRLASPALTAFYVKSQGYPAKVILAADSFAARREYADHYKVPVTHVTAVMRSERSRSLPSR
jgi:hypothetical protein